MKSSKPPVKLGQSVLFGGLMLLASVGVVGMMAFQARGL